MMTALLVAGGIVALLAIGGVGLALWAVAIMTVDDLQAVERSAAEEQWHC